MKNRCYNPAYPLFARYGGRGIVVCPSWRDDFARFLADMGPRPGPGFSLDRIDNDENYEPKNCRWADAKTQSRNCSAARKVVYRGQEMATSQAAELAGIRPKTVYNRRYQGWREADLFAPLGSPKPLSRG